MKLALIIILIIFCILIYLEAFSQEPVPAKQAVRATIGEAAGEGYHGLLAVCVGIRNRGHLRGVYGLNSPIVDKQPRWVWDLAKKAWAESEHNRIHSGTHWESTDFPVPGWANDMVVVYKHKKHIFYKGEVLK